MKSENMKRLEELISGKKDTTVYYDGGTEGHPLFFDSSVAVQRSFLRAGTTFAPHVHEATEIVVVISGTFSSTAAFLSAVTPVAGVVVFQPGVSHSHVAETDCWVIGITIPADKAYPNGK
jgi:quercetin dioxygenase-like cupin family protein